MQISPKQLVPIMAILSLMIVSSAAAQSLSHPDTKSPLKDNKYLKHQNPWRWDINSQVFLRSGRLIIRRDGEFEELSGSYSVQEFEYIYPLITQGGHYWTPNPSIEASLRVDDAKYTPEPVVMQTPGAEAPYFYWISNTVDNNVRQLHFQQKTHVVSADTVFNEQLAKELPWPTQWAPEPQRYLTPIIDRIEDPIDEAGEKRLAELVDQWIEGSDPKSIDQVTLAKFMTGKVIEYVRVVRGRVLTAQQNTQQLRRSTLNPFPRAPSSSWVGMDVRSADQVALEPAGSILDYSTMLVSVLRTVGVPARLVICFDNRNITDNENRIRAMVEFAMFDPESNQTLWIPIDIEELRDHGRRSNTYEQRWEFFGTNENARNFVPLAYFFHPPVNYKAYGYPAFYGFRSNPDIGTRISQLLSIDITNSPMRGDELVNENNP